MGREERQRLGRLQAAGWPFLQMLAKTPWLLTLLLPFMAAVTYDKYYRADRIIKAVIVGQISVIVAGMDVSLKLRPLGSNKENPTGNGKGSMVIFTVQPHRATSLRGLGIA